MSTLPRSLSPTKTGQASRQGAHTAGLVGLVARGTLYLALAFLALELVVGDRSKSADPRGAMHDLADTGFGAFVLVILALGFALFALLHLYRAIRNPDNKTSRRVNDLFWAVTNGFLAVLAAARRPVLADRPIANHAIQPGHRTDRQHALASQFEQCLLHAVVRGVRPLRGIQRQRPALLIEQAAQQFGSGRTTGRHESYVARPVAAEVTMASPAPL